MYNIKCDTVSTEAMFNTIKNKALSVLIGMREKRNDHGKKERKKERKKIGKLHNYINVMSCF